VIGTSAALLLLILLAGIFIRKWCNQQQGENSMMNYEIETEFQEESMAIHELDDDYEADIPFSNSEGDSNLLEDWDPLQFDQGE
jgi:hypothetical protein